MNPGPDNVIMFRHECNDTFAKLQLEHSQNNLRYQLDFLCSDSLCICKYNLQFQNFKKYCMHYLCNVKVAHFPYICIAGGHAGHIHVSVYTATVHV